MVETTYQHFYSMTGDATAAALLTLAANIGQQNPANDSLTVADAAKALNLSLSKTYELCRQGRLRHQRHGRAVRISAADLETFQKNAKRHSA
jgi:excisionase family DNA binding protein